MIFNPSSSNSSQLIQQILHNQCGEKFKQFTNQELSNVVSDDLKTRKTSKSLLSQCVKNGKKNDT